MCAILLHPLYFKNLFKHFFFLEFKFIIEFIYSDLLNENTLTAIIEEKKLINTTATNDSNEIKEILDMNTSEEKWLLTINNLVRLCIQFKLDRLEKLLLNYLLMHFMDLNNVLNILLDALDGTVFESNPSDTNIIDIQTKFKLEKVEELSLSFIKFHIKQIIKLEKFTLLPKDILIKIVRTL